MGRLTSLLYFTLGLLPLISAAAPKLAADSRWLMTGTVRLRAAPDSQADVTSVLRMGDQLRLLPDTADNGYCRVAAGATTGFVACQYLSRVPLDNVRAGVNGVDAAQRWVGGTGVVVRDAPRPDAPVVARLGLNSLVLLRNTDGGNGYCDITLTDGKTGFTACRYLLKAPDVRAMELNTDQLAEPRTPAEAVRAFDLHPSWEAMMRYAQLLQERQPETRHDREWPADAQLERMKEHLARGIYGKRPPPLRTWADLKRLAAQNVDVSPRMRAHLDSHDYSEPMDKPAQAVKDLAFRLFPYELNDDGPVGTEPLNAAQVVSLVRTLDPLPAAPSYFRGDSDIAPPGLTAELASGHFGITLRQLASARYPGQQEAEQSDEYPYAGYYGIQTRIAVLARPVQRVVVMRDGRLVRQATTLRSSEGVHDAMDEEMCQGWFPGFNLGASDEYTWRGYAGSSEAGWKSAAKSNPNPANSVFAFYTLLEPPARAVVTTRTEGYDWRTTGMVRGVWLDYDLNGDAVTDLSIWEGYGPVFGTSAPEPHLWLRFAFVNLQGAWKLLGVDRFHYGCGC